MMTGVKDGIGDQSILVSGESGAGKTESVKIMMHYLAQAAGRQRAGGDADGGTDVATSMLRSNPLLEAFGNARTLRNDNSSRFGKFTRILFDAGGAIVGSRIDVYLLEKSRVVTQTAGERSFHFFYDLAAAPERRISAELRAQLGLMSAEQHLYLSKSGCTTIKGLNDTEEFDTVAEAMGVIGMKDDELVDVCRTIAGVLALGHIEFQETQGASGDLQAWADEDAMQLHSQLFSVEPSALAGALISRQICARDEWYTIQLTKAQAEDSRDGLAKALYERLFNWLVSRINVSTAPQNPTWVKSTIGILDIFGFESFKHNSFEQLLINFANEKLQQQFTWYVFKLEQAEYEKEGIVWNQVDFQDNQPVLDTIEGFGGVLSLLDEESYLQKGKDENFMTKLRKARVRKVAPSPGAKAEPILSFSRMGEANFIIRHYAGFVDYDSVGFREKNKDALHPDMVAMMTASADPFVVSLFPNEAAASDTGKGRSGRLPTLASQFKTSLNELVAGINETAVHYVRCIKPNQHASSNEFDLQGVHEQLRCQGILEAIRIARAAYPNRLVHGEIISRYAFCLFDESLAKPGGAAMEDKIRKTKGEMKRKAEMLMQALNLDTSTYQIGRTKVFFRRVALEELEASRGRVVDRKLTKLQAAVRSMIYRKRFLRMRFAAITVQARGRAYNERRSFVRLRLALIKIQCVGRMIAARNEMYRRKYGVAATKIQTRARLNLYRRRYVSLRFAALIAQREGRRALAMRRYVIAKKEAVEEAKMVNIVNRLQERLAEEMRCREEAEAKLAESATGGPDGEDSPLRVSRSSRASSILSDDGPSDELVEQLEARIKELEESLVRKTEDLEHAHRQLQEQGQELAGAQIEMAAMATAMSSGAGASSDGAQDLAGAVATQREVVVNAVAAARAELQLRLDSQDAELKASRVARMQATNRLNELERSENSRTKRLERELRSVRSELEALNSEREAADVSLRDVHVRSLEKQMAIDRAEADSAKAAANSADEKLTLQQTEMLDVTCTHEDVAALLKQITALNKRSTTQNAELERLRAESLQSATMLADANKQVRLARMQAPAQDGDGIEAAEAEAADKLELTKQLDAMRADAEAAAEAAESANARAEQIQAAEALRASQMAVQIQQQQTEVELLRQDQADLGQKLAVAVAEAAAASAAAGGGASVQEAVAAAKSAVTSASDTRVDQLEQQIQSKDAELLSAVARYEHSEQELKDLRAAQASLEHGSGADKERFEALEKEVALQASQLEARQTELDDLRRLHADQAMELVVAQQEKDVATAQSLSVSAGEQAAKAMAELMKDSKVQDLESQLESKQTQLDELQTKCSALREQLSAAGQQDEHRAELAVQNQRQQDELHNMRLQQVEMGKKFAEMAGEVAAASQASADPSAVLEIVKQARDAATSAAQEQVGGYETQLKELQQQISGKDAEIKALESSARKVADEVTSAKLGAKIGAEKQAALLAQKELLEEKLAMAAAETQRLQEAKAEVRNNHRSSCASATAPLCRLPVTPNCAYCESLTASLPVISGFGCTGGGSGWGQRGRCRAEPAAWLRAGRARCRAQGARAGAREPGQGREERWRHAALDALARAWRGQEGRGGIETQRGCHRGAREGSRGEPEAGARCRSEAGRAGWQDAVAQGPARGE
jgi:myosin heavy subunit